jgi:hypothetical protein
MLRQPIPASALQQRKKSDGTAKAFTQNSTRRAYAGRLARVERLHGAFVAAGWRKRNTKTRE